MRLRQYVAPAPEWTMNVNDGSITFQNTADRHQVVTVFVDHDNELARKENANVPPDPIVVGFELSSLSPTACNHIRNGLMDDFGSASYMDPRCGHRLYVLRPNAGRPAKDHHVYDIIFLGHRPCEIDIDEGVRLEIDAAVKIFCEKRMTKKEKRPTRGLDW